MYLVMSDIYLWNLYGNSIAGDFLWELYRDFYRTRDPLV